VLKLIKFSFRAFGIFLIASGFLAGAFMLFADLRIASFDAATDVSRVLPRHTALLLGTSKHMRGGALNPYYKYRIDAAVELYKAGKYRRIIVSGANPEKYYNEPKTMRDDLVAAGVPRQCVVMDYAGLRTLDSVVRCKNKFGVSDPLIISQDAHARRAMYLAHSFGLAGATAYAAKTPDGSVFLVRNAVREFFARTKAILDVNLLDTRPKHEK